VNDRDANGKEEECGLDETDAKVVRLSEGLGDADAQGVLKSKNEQHLLETR
jgi:hypothetical protein